MRTDRRGRALGDGHNTPGVGMKGAEVGMDRSGLSRRAMFRIAAVLPLAGLAGCGSLGFTSSAETFDLSAPADVKPTGRSGAQILIPDPQALQVLNTERIVVRGQGGDLSYLTGSQWADRLPRLFQAKLVQTFENSGRVRAVGRPGQGLKIDYQIVTDIRSFDYVPSEKAARVEVSVKLMNDTDGRVVGTQVFRATSPVSGEGASAIVAALNEAQEEILTAVLKWVVARV